MGITKLNKLFYYLDFISYRDRRKSITGEKYLPFPKGPFAASLEDEIALAQRKKLLERQKDKSEKYGNRNRFRAVKPYDFSVFDEYEQKLKEKLREEVDEFLTHGDVHELADIIEVIYAIGEVKKMEKHHLEFLRQKKAKERGVFSDKVILIETK